MSILAAIGWMVIGALAVGALAAFWDDIKNWLNNVAADYVERHLGYSARQRMHKAISSVDKVINRVRNKSVIYTKKNKNDAYYDKTTVVTEAPIYEIDNEVIEKIKKEGSIIQEFEYMQ